MSVNNVGHMTIKEYLAKLVNLDYAGQRQLVLEWSGYHSPMLATALAVLDVQGIMKYVDAIVRQGDVWLPGDSPTTWMMQQNVTDSKATM